MSSHRSCLAARASQLLWSSSPYLPLSPTQAKGQRSFCCSRLCAHCPFPIPAHLCNQSFTKRPSFFLSEHLLCFWRGPQEATRLTSGLTCLGPIQRCQPSGDQGWGTAGGKEGELAPVNLKFKWEVGGNGCFSGVPFPTVPRPSSGADLPPEPWESSACPVGSESGLSTSGHPRWLCSPHTAQLMVLFMPRSMPMPSPSVPRGRRVLGSVRTPRKQREKTGRKKRRSGGEG